MSTLPPVTPATTSVPSCTDTLILRWRCQLVFTSQHAEQGAELAASAPEDRSNDSATFLLDIGLRSLAGGNAEAALDRLGACAEHLRHSHAEHAGEQLGAVLGSQVLLKPLHQPYNRLDCVYVHHFMCSPGA